MCIYVILDMSYDQSYISNVKVFNCDLSDYVFLSFFQLVLFHKQTFLFCNWSEYFI